MHERTNDRAALRLRVQAGLCTFFAGCAALLLALGEQLTGFALGWPDAVRWLVPQGAAGYTAATVLVAWGVWAMGSALRDAAAPR